ncbi:hypothetical protein ACA910_009715 [Epithemia clementina (nom. ined.)]
MMKVVASVVVCLWAATASVQAFTSSSSSSQGRSVSALSAEKVPCFGASPFPPIFLGEPVWDKLTMDLGSAATGDYLRSSELKHGRSAMLATVGFAFEKFGITFDKISPHEYLSISKDIKFADLAALGPVDAVKAIPGEGWAQIFAVIAAIEIFELTHRGGEIKEGESIPPGLQAGGLNGYNMNFNPLKITIDDRRKLVELQNGRAAMVAISAWVASETIPGSFPIPLPW